MAELTAAEAEVGVKRQLLIALTTMVSKGGSASMAEIYEAVNAAMSPHVLSPTGKNTLRAIVNRDAVQAGFVHHHDPAKPGWYITPEGREYLKATGTTVDDEVEVVTGPSGEEVPVPSTPLKALGFEKYVLSFMKAVYPEHAWYHQGIHKKHERGLDLIGTRLRAEPDQPRVVGVQVKYHAADNAPNKFEWLDFLSGCFARKVDLGIFVTTGRLTGEQRREAAEAQVVVIEGREEVDRLAARYGLPAFDAPESATVSIASTNVA